MKHPKAETAQSSPISDAGLSQAESIRSGIAREAITVVRDDQWWLCGYFFSR